MKAQLYNQTLSHRFGTELVALVEQSRFLSFDFAVAWVRRSGIEQLSDAMAGLLKRGGTIRGTVGVDIENTSEEGLRDLLELTTRGDAKFWVYHDEQSRSIFHPKIYLLGEAASATLIVGSNNLTLSGLYHNTEAGLQVEAPLADPLILDAQAMLEAWRNEEMPVIRALTPALLQQLLDGGYVLAETQLRDRRRDTADKAKVGKKQDPLFGRTPITGGPARRRTAAKPRARTAAAPVTAAMASAAQGNPTVLLMRVRKARGTQIQISKQLQKEGFFAGVTSITSRVTGDAHGLKLAHARGAVNTIKLEVPETKKLTDPVMRLERDASGISYRVFAAKSAEGRQIMSALKAGRFSSTNPTVLTKPNNPKSSTWWRFV